MAMAAEQANANIQSMNILDADQRIDSSRTIAARTSCAVFHRKQTKRT